MIGFGFSVFTRAILGAVGWFKNASLNLDFTSGVLDPRITFSRTSNATLTGSNGLIQYAPHNLLTYSEQFDNAAWVKTSATIAANVASAPDNTVTAERVTDTLDAVLTVHAVGQAVSWLSGNVYTLSIFGKAGTLEGLHIVLPSTAFGVDTRANFDLVNGTSVVIAGTATASITLQANGYYRCSLTATTTASASSNFQVRTMKVVGGVLTSFYQGDGTGTIFIWGAQLEIGSTATTYNPTTVKNLLGYTSHFDNAAWTKSNASITSGFTDIYGQPFAQKLVENTANSQHICQQSFVPTAGGKYTLATRVKAAERSFAIVGFSGAGLAADCVIGVNLTTGEVVSTVGSPESTSVVSLGSGWYVVSITKTLPTATNCNCRTLVSTDGSTQVYTGDGTSGIYIWGAQLSDSASLDPYVYNPVAAPSAAAYYGPRFDYDPVTLAPKGLLIEEQRTNLCLYGSAINSTTWSANVAPTITANAIVAPDGTTTATLIQASATSSGLFQSVTVSNATVYTLTYYVKNSNGSTIRLGFGGNIVFYNTATSTVTSASGIWTSTSVTSVGNGWYRVSMTGTTAATSYSIVAYGDAAGGALYLWGAQLEAGAFATSYIPTTSSQVTRAADVASMQGANFSNWYNQSEGTLFAEAAVLSAGYATGVLMDIGAGGAFGTTAYMNWFGSGWSLSPNSAPVSMFSTATGTSSAKVAIAMAVNNAVVSANGLNGTTDTSCAMPASATTLTIGKGGWSGAGNYFNGTIKRIAYYPRRLANSELQAITA